MTAAVAGLLDAVDGDGLALDGEDAADELLLDGAADEPMAGEDAAVVPLVVDEHPASSAVASARAAMRRRAGVATWRGYGAGGGGNRFPPRLAGAHAAPGRPRCSPRPTGYRAKSQGTSP